MLVCWFLSISACISIYVGVCISLYVYVFASLYGHMHACVSLCWLYHQQSTAFNEGDRRKINIVPLKMISSHPFIASHFHPFTVWERAQRGRKFESLHPSVNISLSSFMSLFWLYSFLSPQLCTVSSVFNIRTTAVKQ